MDKIIKRMKVFISGKYGDGSWIQFVEWKEAGSDPETDPRGYQVLDVEFMTSAVMNPPSSGCGSSGYISFVPEHERNRLDRLGLNWLAMEPTTEECGVHPAAPPPQLWYMCRNIVCAMEGQMHDGQKCPKCGSIGIPHVKQG